MLKLKHLVIILVIVAINFFYVVWYILNQNDLNGRSEKFSDIFGGATRWTRSDGVVNNEFRVHANYRVAQVTVGSNDLTLVSQCSINNLYWVIQQTYGWSPAPLSIAIFAAGEEGYLAKEIIDRLRKCVPEVKKYVTFHLLYPTAFPPSTSEESVPDDCSQLLALIEKLEKGGNYRRLDRIKYPQNSLRNLARDNVKTELFYLVDIDTLPSANFKHDFFSFMNKNPDLFLDKMSAFVTPAFELDDNIKDHTPKSRKELLELQHDKKARQFHVETCPHCHHPANYSWWEADSNEDIFEIEYFSAFEPFYVSSTETTPFYDERFKAYGYDRISQLCEMHVKGFTFYTFKHGFVSHFGFKTAEGMHANKNKENQQNWLNYEQIFKPMLRTKYPSSERQCRDNKEQLKKLSAGGRSDVKF